MSENRLITCKNLKNRNNQHRNKINAINKSIINRTVATKQKQKKQNFMNSNRRKDLCQDRKPTLRRYPHLNLCNGQHIK